MHLQKRNPAVWPLLIGLAAVIIFGAVITAISLNSGLASNSAQVTQDLELPTSTTLSEQATPDTSPTESPVPTLVITDEATATDEPTPDEQATQDFIATDTAWKLIVRITTEYLATTLATQAPVATGIYDDDRVKVQLRKEGYEIENAWFGYLNSVEVAAYVGAYQDDPDQGLLHVFLFRDPTFEHDYLTPLRAGSVRVVAEHNNRLTLLSVNGATFYFDAPALQFVASLTEVAPTITPFGTPSATWTPSPTYTPLPTYTPGPSPTFAPTPTFGLPPLP